MEWRLSWEDHPVKDFVVLVTGASGGVGSSIGSELLLGGAEVMLLGRSAARLQAAFPPTRNFGGMFLVADLTDAAAVENVGNTIIARGRLDALILSSGIYERSNTPQVFDQQIAANVLGPYALIQMLLPTLVQSKGQIIFINSSQALRASATVGQYAATMHATKAIADSLRDEVNGQEVRVTSLYLGRTAGERQRKIFEYERRLYPPEKLLQPIDVARTVRFLLEMPKTAEVTDLMIRPMQKT
jgi:NADP-dependent 3-hydroxy acid dehydrogenase YdfG